MRKTVVLVVGLLLCLTASVSAEQPQTVAAQQEDAVVRDVVGVPAQMNCGTDTAMQALYSRNPDSEREAREFDQMSTALIAQGFLENVVTNAETYVIPTVFHVFGTSYAGITINDALIIDALNKLNQDFQGLTADWGSVSAQFSGIKRPLSIAFKLAKKDPSGQATTGITYHGTVSGFGNDFGWDSQIQQYAWDNYKYFNVYIMLDLYADGATNNSGVCWYPDTWMSNNNLARAVYNGRYIGTNTTENFRRVLTHEFGHYLNLIHTFQGGCSDPNDQVSDTPRTTSNSGTCNTSIVRCSGAGVPNGENFMDYTLCYRMFTAGQVARMQAALQHPARVTLWQPSNLIATGLSTGTSCTYTISPTSASYAASGGSGSVSVTTATGCSRTATSNVSWITISGGASGTGSGTVSYSVASNTTTSSRTGTATIAGNTFTVTQTGTSGGGGTLQVISPNGGESWSRGSARTISWSKGSAARVDVALYKGTSFIQWITWNNSNTSFSWTIPTSLSTGSDYKITVIDYDNRSVTDSSNSNFTIN